jgi:hypothetical protein
MLLGTGDLALSALAVMFGVNMLPASATMQGKLGTTAPLIITWGMIWITVAMGIVLAIYVFAYGLGKVRRW